MTEKPPSDFSSFLRGISDALKDQSIAREESQRVSKLQDRHDAEIEKSKAEIRRVNTITDLQQRYANRTFWFLICWMVWVGLLVVFQAFGLFGFELADFVLAVITGGTAIAVVGLVLAVIKGLFDSDT